MSRPINMCCERWTIAYMLLTFLSSARCHVQQTPHRPSLASRRMLVTAGGHLPASGAPRQPGEYDMIHVPQAAQGQRPQGDSVQLQPTSATIGGLPSNHDPAVAEALATAPSHDENIQRQVRLGMTLKDWVRRSSAQERAGIAVCLKHWVSCLHQPAFYFST